MNYFPKTNSWVIPEAALKRSKDEMAVDGEQGNEGTCLWLGIKENNVAKLTHVVLLRGDGVRKGPANVEISPELMREVHEKARALHVILIGQIHSHGQYYGVDLSLTDHRYGVQVPYFLSIVYPDYAQTESTTIIDCGVHIFLPRQGYVRLSEEDIADRILITAAAEVEILTVGKP